MPEGHANFGGAHVNQSTGAVPFNSDPVTYAGEVPSEPTGAVDGPPAEVTYNSEPYWDGPAGNVEHPSEPVTHSQWPGNEPAPVEESAMGSEVVEPAQAKSKRAAARKRGK